MKVLRPGDVLLRRYDSYLDAKVLPGFWNHAGICTNDNEVIHAIAKGVVAETVFDFCKTDHLVVLRPKFKLTRYDVITTALSYVGRPYDFNFNVDCDDKFYCTEIIYKLFENFDHGIKRRKFLGVDMVAADDIYSANFDVVLEYKN